MHSLVVQGQLLLKPATACTEEALTFTAADALAAMADCQYDWSTIICAMAEKKNIISNLQQASKHQGDGFPNHATAKFGKMPCVL